MEEKSFGFIFGIHAEIFGSDFQGFTEFHDAFIQPQYARSPQSEVQLIPFPGFQANVTVILIIVVSSAVHVHDVSLRAEFVATVLV